ncbi:hypothetical protein [Pseudoalteromonas sp. R3]|uniref:hypothetical protein n=1 Tax=Pseudoalteromonas sp. R3 TaxID=1709477 RepID=UPI0006B5158D|nr:hypothetical protein [Pseudoalteromonas sp. R3]AZZ98879.1 hypothetical protein ELR70_18295 [Pseudoalteromonas sp. R3]
MKFRILTLIFVLLASTKLIGCSGETRITSPDENREASVRSDSGILVLSILDAGGENLYTVNTGASDFQHWSIEWLNNSELLLRSSDIGPVLFVNQPDGSWEKVNPLKKLSPDGLEVIHTYWNNYKEKTLSLNILEAHGDAEAAFIVKQKIETKIVVLDLVNCAQWQGNNNFVIKTGKGERIFTKDQDGTWVEKMANNKLLKKTPLV